MKIAIGRKTMMGTVVTLLVGGIALALVAAGGIVAWEYTNSNAFCANMCHAVHPEEPVAHAASATRACSASNATWAACRRCS